MTEDLRKAIADYFDPCEFAEYIGISVEQIIDKFEDEVEEALPDILELMEYGTGKDSED